MSHVKPAEIDTAGSARRLTAPGGVHYCAGVEHRFIALLAAAAVLFGAITGAHAGGRDEFNRAIALEREGKMRDALGVLGALADTKAEFSDDALLEAGRVHEEEMLDGEQAVASYGRLIKEFPNSRLVRRAAARIEALRSVEPRHLRAALEFRRAVLDFPKDNKASMERVLNLLQKSPDFPGADHAYFWLGEVTRGRKDYVQAEGYYHTVIGRYAQSQWAWKARRSLGDLAYDKKDYAAAADRYREAAAAPDQYLHSAALADAERAETHLFRGRAANLAILLLFLGWAYVLVALSRLRPGIKAAKQPVPEAWVALGLSIIVVAAAAVFQRRYVPGIAVVLAAFLISIQLSGTLLRYRVYSTGGKIAYLLATLGIGFGVLYGAIVKMGLMGSVLHTFRFGVD
ncbi:MAG: tetratricopeptide repeat protein [Deltaproteobacteria bacterium]|nr:tetratricopeptide repeat protein [Deltaproteobacteria bacterium]